MANVPFTQYKPKTSNRVQALKVTSSNIYDVATQLRGRVDVGNLNTTVLLIPTLEGNLTANVGDYIIDNQDGSLTVKYGPDFESTWDVPGAP